MKDVLVLDDDETLCNTLKMIIEVVAPVQCWSVRSFEALRKLESDLPRFGVAMLDINLGYGQPSGLDAYAWLKEKNFSGKIIFFTGHAKLHPDVLKAAQIPGVQIEPI